MAVRRYNPNAKPPVTMALVGINVGIALIDMFSGGYLERLFYARGIDIQYGQYWRLFTCAWVHANLLHIAFNGYGIYLLGTIMERLHGWKSLLVIYFVSLFGGSALAMAFMDPSIPLLGASGAAYGLFGAVLGFFYAKTGSIRGILQVPFGRQLMIWLVIGIVFSMQPGVSFLGHAGGFIPGAILGVFFEHRYMRQIDIYHKLSAGMVVVAVFALTAFSLFPVTRASWYASQALRAYEHNDFERGDALMQEAEQRNKRDDGTRRLMTHLKLWRVGHALNPREFDDDILVWPLTHTEPFSYVESRGLMSGGRHAIAFKFLNRDNVTPGLWYRVFPEDAPADDTPPEDEPPEDEPPEPVESPTDDE